MSTPPDLQRRMDEHRAKRDAGRGQMYALEIPTAVIVGCVLGKLADDHFGIAPIGITVGLIAGLGAAIRAIVGIIRWQKSLPTSGDVPVDTDDLSRSINTGGDTPPAPETTRAATNPKAGFSSRSIEREGGIDDTETRGQP